MDIVSVQPMPQYFEVGIKRITDNFKDAPVDDALQIDDGLGPVMRPLISVEVG